MHTTVLKYFLANIKNSETNGSHSRFIYSTIIVYTFIAIYLLLVLQFATYTWPIRL